MPKKKYRSRLSKTQERNGVKHGYRSGLEKMTADDLNQRGVDYEYETMKIQFTQPAKVRTYTPDFILPNGIIIETKGRFTTADRMKHLIVKEEHPDLDIRFVFSNANAPIYKGSPTSNAKWAEKHGFQWAHRRIPQSWITEKPRGQLQ